MRRGRLHTTTVRFDRVTWAALVAEAHALGIANAEFIRVAVLLHLGRQAAADRLDVLERRQDELAGRVQSLARVVVALAGGFRGQR